MGRVEGEPLLDAGEYWYRVRFVRRIENVVEEDLDAVDEGDSSLIELAMRGRWGRISAFRCALAIDRITYSSKNTVYTYRAQRILFEPYQYKPLLKILNSPDRRLLVADEVGLGKTIEAGLILTELEARQYLDRVLVVCPSRLRDKWKEELNRKFGQDFEIFDRRALREYITRAEQNPDRSRLRAIISMQTLRSQDLLQRLEGEVGYIDLVIVDEAHHARNPETMTSAMLREVGALGDAVLLLTATPLHLGSQDLFTLLNALRRTEFRESAVFDSSLRHHRGVLRAGAIIRSGQAAAAEQAVVDLRQVFQSADGQSIEDPIARQVIADLSNRPPTDRRGWVEMERRVQELHPLSSILTRTKKRDVQENAPTRKATVLRRNWTDEEDAAYRQLVGATQVRGWVGESLSLGQIQRARQAASSIHAAILTRAGAPLLSDDDAVEMSDISPSEAERIAGHNPDRGFQVPSLPAHDSKLEWLVEILTNIEAEGPRTKVLIFTFFVGTAKYLASRLTRAGFPAIWIAGEVHSDPRDPDRDERGRRMNQFRDDCNTQVLVSTEVGSEGLDFQFCHHLVNYDLPWNPMVVEQRIGRIDRFGQRSPVVQIYSLVVEGTVEDRILYRLFDRIGIFRESIGDLEAILGETVRELRRDYFSGKLTPGEAEARVEQAAIAIEQRRLHTEQLERSAGELFGHEEFIKDELKRIRKLGRYISGDSMLALVRSFLESFHPDVQMWEESKGVCGLRLTEDLDRDIRSACTQGQLWIRRRQGEELYFTTDGVLAFERPDLELLNLSHPLLRAAVDAQRPRMQQPVALVGKATLYITEDEDPDLVSGIYFIFAFAHEVGGTVSRREMEPVVWHHDSGGLVGSEAGERLLHLVIERGEEWALPDPAPPLDSAATWDQILGEARRRNRELRENRALQNEAFYLRRKATLRAEYEHRRAEIRLRMETARLRERSAAVLGLFEAQLSKAQARLEAQLQELESNKQQLPRLVDPVAACVAAVIRRPRQR
jgi:superfamily II DNA or RNA helicase